jgi:hypothetical protein
MNNIYGMQRANGDWFAIEEKLNFRVPLFSSHKDAMQVRALNVEMLLFKPVLIDERLLEDVAQIEDKRSVHFWLVDEASTNMKRGTALRHEQLALILRSA